ncbi:MAG: hypothetical protein QM728_13910 [Gordonia sp. (in: high G+C Gram-positive bacteria)]|uniref:hypothetical protein n=1 Tax=Gordonia sp. (in: high G+C Gram-positive bacteria) TaxID=84139 RepID=UPI0039E70F7C
MAPAENSTERFMRFAIECVHEVELELWDTNGRQNAVDYVFTSPNGNGAVEVTSIRNSDAAAWYSVLGESHRIAVPSPRGWSLEVGLHTRRSDLLEYLPGVIRLCDQVGVDRLGALTPSEWTDDVQWVASNTKHLRTAEWVGQGQVFIRLPGVSGMVTVNQDVLDDQVAALLNDPRLEGKLAKLRLHPDVSERHIAVGVDLYGTEFGLVDALLRGRDLLPTYTPPADFCATHIWLNGGGWVVLAWNRDESWRWCELPRDAQPS